MARLNLSNPNLVQKFTGPTGLLTVTFTALTGFTGVQWSSTGRDVLAIVNGATASNYTLSYAPVYGTAVVTPITAACPVSNVVPQFLGPFPSAFTQNDNLSSIFVDFSSVVTVTVAVITLPGVV